MGFLDTDFGKMILFMVLGGVFLVLVLGFSKSPKATAGKAGVHSSPSSTPSISTPSGETGDNPYDPSNLIG